MTETEFEQINKLIGGERYECFLDIAAEEREIWILLNESGEFLKVYSEDNDIEFLPVWPDQLFAQAYSEAGSEKLKAESVSLPQFLSKWVPGLEGDGIDVGVFPGNGSDIWIMTPAELKSDLQEALSNAF